MGIVLVPRAAEEDAIPMSPAPIHGAVPTDVGKTFAILGDAVIASGAAGLKLEAAATGAGAITPEKGSELRALVLNGCPATAPGAAVAAAAETATGLPTPETGTYDCTARAPVAGAKAGKAAGS